MQILQTSGSRARNHSKNVPARFLLPQGHMITSGEEIEQLTEKIIGCAIEVHRILGPGLLESVYPECMMIEMRREGLRFESSLTIRGSASEAR